VHLASKALDEAPYKLSEAVVKLASITFWSLAFSWTDKPWFLTEGKLAVVLIKPSSWGSQLDGDLYHHTLPQHEHGGQIIKITVGQDASARCARWPVGPDSDAFSVRAPMQMVQDRPFASPECVIPLEMP
jgi:hypothetical protein